MLCALALWPDCGLSVICGIGVRAARVSRAAWRPADVSTFAIMGAPTVERMSRLAAIERHALVEEFARAEPTAPTLCAGWDARVLLAHLVRRESSLIELGGRLTLPIVTAASQRSLQRYAERTDFSTLVSRLRAGAPWYSPFALPPLDEAVNLLEFVIHHEDLRRGADPEHTEPRTMSQATQAAVFERLRMFVKLTMRKLPDPIKLSWPHHGDIVVGKVDARAAAAVVVSGEPVELALLAGGRFTAARVTYSGQDDAIARLVGASVGA